MEKVQSDGWWLAAAQALPPLSARRRRRRLSAGGTRGSLGGQATNANVASYCGFFTHSNPPQQIAKVLASRYWSCFMSWGPTAIGLLCQNAIVTLVRED